MGIVHFDKLPEDRREAAHAALRQVLGAVPVDAATPLAGGATTAAVFRIEAGERRYVLRVEGTPSPLRNPHQYQSMRIASDAGIAPRLHYFDEDSRVAVIDYVEPQPLGSFAGGPPALAQALGELLAAAASDAGLPQFRRLSRHRCAAVGACVPHRTVRARRARSRQRAPCRNSRRRMSGIAPILSHATTTRCRRTSCLTASVSG